MGRVGAVAVRAIKFGQKKTTTKTKTKFQKASKFGSSQKDNAVRG